MRQGVTAGHKVFFRFGAGAFLVQNLQDAGLELRHVRDVVCRHSVLSGLPRDDDRVHVNAVVNGFVGQTEIELDGGHRGCRVAETAKSRRSAGC